MKFGPIKTIGIYVEDQKRSIEFYTKRLGFTLRRSLPMTPDVSWVEVSPPGAESALVLYPRSMMPNWAELKPSIVFYAEDVRGLCAGLEAAGVTITMQPTQLPWGLFAKFTDPDWNEFGITTQPLAD
jgi:predicted enzyme related to lactoylglutathione lyase